MNIDYSEIKTEIEMLKDMTGHYGNTELTHKSKMDLSNMLAELCFMVRLKYGLNSGYYTPAEYKAYRKVGQIVSSRTIAERLDASEVTEEQSKWVINWSGYCECDKCKHEAPIFRNANTAVSKMTKFCPYCGLKMKNGM